MIQRTFLASRVKVNTSNKNPLMIKRVKKITSSVVVATSLYGCGSFQVADRKFSWKGFLPSGFKDIGFLFLTKEQSYKT